MMILRTRKVKKSEGPQGKTKVSNEYHEGLVSIHHRGTGNCYGMYRKEKLTKFNKKKGQHDVTKHVLYLFPGCQTWEFEADEKMSATPNQINSMVRVETNCTSRKDALVAAAALCGADLDIH